MVSFVATNLAMYSTAPHEAAAALLLVVADSRLVAAAAAQQPAAVQPRRRPVARAPARAQDTQAAKIA